MEVSPQRAAGESGGPEPDRPAAGESGGPEPDRPAAGESGGPGSDPPAAGESGGPGSDPPAAGESGGPGSDPPAAGESGSPEPAAGEMQSWVVQQDAQELAASLRADPCREAKELNESIEEMLIRLDEFCGMLDMIRNDSSQILDENIPKIKVKAREMKEVYAKIDKMEIFVKMVEQSAAMLEEQVIQAEKDCGNRSRGVCKFLHSINAPFLNKKRSCLSQQNLAYELPNLYRTEAYFPANHNRTFFKPSK
ncbi:biogenesis of lysosome-related organelles complex 1 subunit 4-like [Pristis pectinata]|uniref:biogenesis of lysosome-related organelles complex 1 subunit 4-like n=1 Tax=Pristis pectinata TaxID=685728 RepID=UPI00223C9D58|nr:biogenesis of lysosome-related organelles complex 1 subunit 4-like [Pristis pectinata]